MVVFYNEGVSNFIEAPNGSMRPRPNQIQIFNDAHGFLSWTQNPTAFNPHTHGAIAVIRDCKDLQTLPNVVSIQSTSIPEGWACSMAWSVPTQLWTIIGSFPFVHRRITPDELHAIYDRRRFVVDHEEEFSGVFYMPPAHKSPEDIANAIAATGIASVDIECQGYVDATSGLEVTPFGSVAWENLDGVTQVGGTSADLDAEIASTGTDTSGIQGSFSWSTAGIVGDEVVKIDVQVYARKFGPSPGEVGFYLARMGDAATSTKGPDGYSSATDPALEAITLTETFQWYSFTFTLDVKDTLTISNYEEVFSFGFRWLSGNPANVDVDSIQANLCIISAQEAPV